MKTSFKIYNNLKNEILFLHEPEAWEFRLPRNEEIVVETESVVNSIRFTLSVEDDQHVINIADDSSLYTIFHKGIDVFQEYK